MVDFAGVLFITQETLHDKLNHYHYTHTNYFRAGAQRNMGFSPDLQKKKRTYNWSRHFNCYCNTTLVWRCQAMAVKNVFLWKSKGQTMLLHVSSRSTISAVTFF